MSTKIKFRPTGTSQKVPGLEHGTKYVIQNMSYYAVLYANYPTDPAASTDDLSWGRLGQYEAILEDHSTADALWVRVPSGDGELAIWEAE